MGCKSRSWTAIPPSAVAFLLTSTWKQQALCSIRNRPRCARRMKAYSSLALGGSCRLFQPVEQKYRGWGLIKWLPFPPKPNSAAFEDTGKPMWGAGLRSPGSQQVQLNKSLIQTWCLMVIAHQQYLPVPQGLADTEKFWNE